MERENERESRERGRKSEQASGARQAWVANSFAPYSTAAERPTTTISQRFDQSARTERATVTPLLLFTVTACLFAPRGDWSRSPFHWLFLKAASRVRRKRGSLLKNRERGLDKSGADGRQLAGPLRADTRLEMQRELTLRPYRW